MRKQFFYKLIPPRPTFDKDMTEAESQIMKQHSAYWRYLTARGAGLIFGPVSDPKGVWGMGIMEVDDEAQARAIAADDPAVKSGLNTYEIYPMRVGIIRQ